MSQLIDRQNIDVDRDAMGLCDVDYQIPHDAFHAALIELRRKQPAELHEKDIAHGSADQMALGIAQQSLGNHRIVPFRARNFLRPRLGNAAW